MVVKAQTFKKCIFETYYSHFSANKMKMERTVRSPVPQRSVHDEKGEISETLSIHPLSIYPTNFWCVFEFYLLWLEESNRILSEQELRVWNVLFVGPSNSCSSTFPVMCSCKCGDSSQTLIPFSEVNCLNLLYAFVRNFFFQ